MLKRFRAPLPLAIVLGLSGLQAASAPVAQTGTCLIRLRWSSVIA